MRALLLGLLFVSTARAAPLTRDLEVYATTDIHGHIEPSLVPTHHGPGAVQYVERGGIALIGGFLANARAHFPNRVILLDGGDMFQGTLASNLTEGATMLRGLNQIGYTAAALGNHEFDYGPLGLDSTVKKPGETPRGALDARVAEASFPFLAANVIAPASEKLALPYVVRTIDGVPVGIVGGTSDNLLSTTMRSNLDGLRVEKMIPSVVKAAADARSHGARVILVTVHAGAECDRAMKAWSWHEPDDLRGCRPDEEVFELARALSAATDAGGPKISAIVGGHTHQPIAAVVAGIPIVQAGKNGQSLGHVSIEVTGVGEAATPTGHFAIERMIDVCPRLDAKNGCARIDDKDTHPNDYFGEVKASVAVEKAIDKDLVVAHAAASRPIGIDLPEGIATSYHAECALGNLVADTIRAAAKADIGFVNGGGLRADLPVGELTYGALYESFPFDNEVVTIDLTGVEVGKLVSRNLHSEHGALSYSGLHVKAACKDGKVETTLTLPNGSLIAPNAHYKVATLDFLAHGGDDALGGPMPLGPALGIVRDVLESSLHAHGKSLRPEDEFDPRHRRVELPGPRPIKCP